MLEPEILSPWLAEQRNLPKQITLDEGTNSYAEHLRKSIPFYDEMISMIPTGGSRPSIPEYQAIAEHIRQALDDVYYGIKNQNKHLMMRLLIQQKALGW